MNALLIALLLTTSIPQAKEPIKRHDIRAFKVDKCTVQKATNTPTSGIVVYTGKCFGVWGIVVVVIPLTLNFKRLYPDVAKFMLSYFKWKFTMKFIKILKLRGLPLPGLLYLVH